MIDNSKVISVIGKDRRLQFCYEELRKAGYNTILCTDEAYIRDNVECYIFGVPFKKNMLPKDMKLINPKGKVFGGIIDSETMTILNNYGLKVIDYGKSEFFLKENALLTAEAAMMVYIGSVGEGFKGSEVLVSGFGRIGKALAHLLSSHGANVTVSARKYNDIERISDYGCYPMETCAINGNYDVIFNTIPANVFTRDILDRTKAKTYVELSSAPYGIESFSNWGENTRIILASGLPGKVLPVSAGRIIKEAVIEELSRDA